MSENITKKYRPLKFGQVIGQPTAVEKMTSAISKGVIPPAYIFIGMRGMGKTTCARIEAMALNCEHKLGVEPCGECPSCKEIIAGNSDYLVEVDGATNSKVEDMRNLMGSVGYFVPEGHYKVILIDECHSLSKQAWDASLKTIEEPPPRVLFIFSTTEIQKVSATVKSRCVPVQFPAASETDIVEMLRGILTKENVPFEDKALLTIAKESGGSIRDAQSILEGFIRSGKVTTENVQNVYMTVAANTIITYFNNIVSKDREAASRTTVGWIRSGHTPELVLNSLLEHIRNMLMPYVINDPNLKSMLKAQLEKISDGRAVQWLDYFQDQIKYLREYPMEYSLVLDIITIRLIDTLSVRIEKKKKSAEDDEKKEKAEVAPPKPQPLNNNLINELLQACKGTIAEASADYRRVTLINAKGTTFDVVAEPSLAKSQMFVLGADLPEILKDYPASMPKYAQQKN